MRDHYLDMGKKKVGEPSTVQMHSQERVFVLDAKDVQTSAIVVSGTLFVNSVNTKILFYTGSTHSFVVPSFVHKNLLCPASLKSQLSVVIPYSLSVLVTLVFLACKVLAGENITFADLFILSVLDFSVILGMDWLAANQAVVDCFNKRITFGSRDNVRFVIQRQICDCFNK